VLSAEGPASESLQRRLTEAAHQRNIEIGLIVTGAFIAGAVEHHIEALIARGHLRPLLLGN
jgi:hypothetical protein